MEIVENCVFEAVPFKKSSFPYFTLFKLSSQKIQRKVVQSFDAHHPVPLHILERVFLQQWRSLSTYFKISSAAFLQLPSRT